LREVVGVKTPERLDRDVEGTAGDLGCARCGFKDQDQLWRWPDQAALAVERRERRVPALQAENPLQSVDLGEA
jgi:hypothetical protein